MNITNTPAWVRIVAAISVGIVAFVAAVVSYVHMQEVAFKAGETWRSWFEPLSVDGLLTGASMVLYVNRRNWFAWIGVAVGISVSLAANLAAAQPTLASHLVSAWPAIALALSYETLLTLLRHMPAPQATQQPEPVPVAVAAIVEDEPAHPTNNHVPQLIYAHSFGQS